MLPPADHRGMDAHGHRRWQWAGVAGIGGFAVILFVASLAGREQRGGPGRCRRVADG